MAEKKQTNAQADGVLDLLNRIEQSDKLAKEVARLRETILDIQKDYQERMVELQMSIRALEIIVLSEE